MPYIAAVDVQSGVFLYGATPPKDVEPGLSSGQIRVVCPRKPNPVTERYSGDHSDPIRLATDQELSAANSTKRKTVATRDVIRQMTDEQFATLQQESPRVVALMLADTTTDLHAPEFAAVAAVLAGQP